MSNYRRMTKHPITGEFEWADWLDDYYGPSRYGVTFPGSDVVFVEANHEWEFDEAAEEALARETDQNHFRQVSKKAMQAKNAAMAPSGRRGVSGRSKRTTEVDTGNDTPEFERAVLELFEDYAHSDPEILGGDPVIRGTRIPLERFSAVLLDALRKAVIEELKYVRDHSSGGGSWRGVIALRIEKLREEGEALRI